MATHAALSNILQFSHPHQSEETGYQAGDEVYDDGFLIIEAEEVEHPPSYSEAISEPPPPYTAGEDSQFLSLANAELPSYIDSTAPKSAHPQNLSNPYSAPNSAHPQNLSNPYSTHDNNGAGTSTDSTQNQTSKFANNYALNSVPFDLSPLLTQNEEFYLPAPPVLCMRNYWYDFSFERTFLRDFDAFYGQVSEFNFEFGSSGDCVSEERERVGKLKVELPEEREEEVTHDGDDINLMFFD